MEPVRTRAIRAMLDGHEGVLSFDVFDTLLWRRTPRPVEGFHDIPRVAARAGIKLPPISGSQYATTRKRAESTALFAALLFAHEGVKGALDNKAASHFAVGGVGQAISAWLSGDVELDQDELVELLAALIDQLAAMPPIP